MEGPAFDTALQCFVAVARHHGVDLSADRIKHDYALKPDDDISLVPENGRLELELAGDLAGILALSAGYKKPVTAGRDGLQVTLVAGTGSGLCDIFNAQGLEASILPA